MQKRITSEKIKAVLCRTFLPLVVLCISSHASFAQKQPAGKAKNSADEQRKKADAAGNAGTSAAFSDAVSNQSPASVKAGPAFTPVADKKTAAVKRKNTQAPTADITSKPKNN